MAQRVALVALVMLSVAWAREPSPTPTVQPFVTRWTAQQVVDAFAAAGLPAGSFDPAENAKIVITLTRPMTSLRGRRTSGKVRK